MVKGARGATIGARGDKIGVRIGEKIDKIEEKIEHGFYFSADLGTHQSDVCAACSVSHVSCWHDAVTIVRQIIQIQKAMSLKLKNLSKAKFELILRLTIVL